MGVISHPQKGRSLFRGKGLLPRVILGCILFSRLSEVKKVIADKRQVKELVRKSVFIGG